MLIAGQEKGQGWVRFLHGARLTGNLLTLGKIRHPTIKKNDYYPLIARAVGLTGAPGSSPGGLRAGAQSRRAIALQPVRADPPVVSALDPPMPASVPPPASAPLPVPASSEPKETAVFAPVARGPGAPSAALVPPLLTAASVPPPASAEDAKSSGPYWTSLRSHPIAGSPV